MFDALSQAMQSVITVLYSLTQSMGFASYGLAIILLTFVIKVLTYPLTVKQVKSMKAMQEIQPKVKELEAKHKNNKEKFQKEVAVLYKESGVNPLAGCLPMLVQMPFLIAIFYALRDYTYVGNPGFLWMTNLADPDPLHVLPLLAVATTYWQQKQTQVTPPAGSEGGMANQQTKMMMIFMPLFIGYISWSFSSGLVIYWVFGNMVQIFQQWWMYRKPAQG